MIKIRILRPLKIRITELHCTLRTLVLIHNSGNSEFSPFPVTGTSEFRNHCIVVAGTSVEFQALLAEIKQKDKQREELLMKLKVCLVVIIANVLSTELTIGNVATIGEIQLLAF